MSWLYVGLLSNIRIISRLHHIGPGKVPNRSEGHVHTLHRNGIFYEGLQEQIEMIMAVLKGVLYCLLRGRERMWKERLWGRRSK